MSDKVIGVAVSGANAPEILARIERSEQAGIPAVWMTTGGARPDSLTTFAVAAGRTNYIKQVLRLCPLSPVILW